MRRSPAHLPCYKMTLVLLAGLVSALAYAAKADVQVGLNSVGFPLQGEKIATITGDCHEFSIVEAQSRKEVLHGTTARLPGAEGVSIADFSKLSTAGTYRLVVDGQDHPVTFTTGNSVFNYPFHLCTRAMYLWRCGTEVHAVYAGRTYHHGACHLEDGSTEYVDERGETQKDGVGGWHDAGDYNKYVGNGAFTAGMMLAAWEHFEPQLRNLNLRIPESNNDLPDFLDEIRWELEWLLKMQAADGRVYHKLSTLKFGGMVAPENESAVRYFCPWGSPATADFVAVMAKGARAFRPYDPAFADRCLDAARKSYDFLVEHPENHQPDQSKFATGQYPTEDDDDRLWAVAELWEATGDRQLLSDLEQRIRDYGVVQGPSPNLVTPDWDWSDVRNLGLFTYVLSQRTERDPQLVARVTEDAVACADHIVGITTRHPYGRALGHRYYWGCNGTVARLSMNLEVARRLSPDPEYRQAQLHALSHLFGRNPYGRSYVTGIGHLPPLHPHDRRSAGDQVDLPWPGYLIGGPWPAPTDWQDDEEDYRTNETAINWNGALIYALAVFVEPDSYNESLRAAEHE